MKTNVTIIDIGDLLSFASSIGINWNVACDVLADDGVNPMYESNSTDLYPGVAKDYGWSETSERIVEGFLAANNLKSCTLIRD